MFNVIKKWSDEKLEYLNTKEKISSSEPARQHLSLMDALNLAFKGMSDSNKPALHKLGDEIRIAKYETKYSKWTYEKLSDVKELEDKVVACWISIREQSDHKRKVLDDDLAREICKEEICLWVRNHLEMANFITAWSAERLAYLKVCPDPLSAFSLY